MVGVSFLTEWGASKKLRGHVRQTQNANTCGLLLLMSQVVEPVAVYCLLASGSTLQVTHIAIVRDTDSADFADS